MTLDKFKQLPYGDQCAYVVDYGRYLLERKWGRNNIFLYGFDSFFVEVYHRNGKVFRLNAFDSVAGLDRYLRWVRILYNYGIITLNPRTGDVRK